MKGKWGMEETWVKVKHGVEQRKGGNLGWGNQSENRAI